MGVLNQETLKQQLEECIQIRVDNETLRATLFYSKMKIEKAQDAREKKQKKYEELKQNLKIQQSKNSTFEQRIDLLEEQLKNSMMEVDKKLDDELTVIPSPTTSSEYSNSNTVDDTTMIDTALDKSLGKINELEKINYASDSWNSAEIQVENYNLKRNLEILKEKVIKLESELQDKK